MHFFFSLFGLASCFLLHSLPAQKFHEALSFGTMLLANKHYEPGSGRKLVPSGFVLHSQRKSSSRVMWGNLTALYLWGLTAVAGICFYSNRRLTSSSVLKICRERSDMINFESMLCCRQARFIFFSLLDQLSSTVAISYGGYLNYN